MSRWDPNARGRLESAALELFAEQGFAETTVPQITKRAGLTTRTFFRYFADKREVLFSGEDDMRMQFAEIIRSAPSDASPIGIIEHGLKAVATTMFEPRRHELRSWRAVVATDEGLRERALRKQQLTAETVVAALRERGIDEQTADLLAGLATLVLQSAVARWVERTVEKKSLVSFVDETLDQVRSIVSSHLVSSGDAGSPARDIER